ncbi:cytochrome P450 [Agromyces sp. Root81]|uniref:cytochrome P450 n=1 Tax=Agromyces sp. Root81 TaxID=1736601 RepID=UPI0009EC02B3|nr:cytochrome P450 [Agromyces sp. Root81]
MTAAREAPVSEWVTIPDMYRDPFPIFQRMRAEAAVHWVPSVNRYMVVTYDECHTAEMDGETFSADETGSLMKRSMGHSMLRKDDPEHAPERAAWQPPLRPGAIKTVWREVFEANTERYLDRLADAGDAADLIWDFAAPLAAENLRSILGFVNATQEDLQRWSQTMIDATGNYADDPVVWEKGRRSSEEVDRAIDELLPYYAAHPDASLISGLVNMPGGERLPIEAIRANLKMTIGGGLNEPRDVIGTAAWALLENPDQLGRVLQDPALWPVAFDEAIRWIAPIGMYPRETTRDVELGGVRLPAGSRLGIVVLSANRDERVFEYAERFDIAREKKPHLAFGGGAHYCAGAWVAKSSVAQVALPRLFERFEGLEIDGDRETSAGGWVFRGMLKLPVTWQRERKGAAA